MRGYVIGAPFHNRRNVAVRVAAQTLLTQTLGRMALNFHRRKEWTSAAIGASLSPCRDMGRWLDPGSCPAGDGATAGLRWWRRLVPLQPKRILNVAQQNPQKDRGYARQEPRETACEAWEHDPQRDQAG